MKSRPFIVGYVLALALLVFAQRHPGTSSPTGIRAVVDLTHAINARSLTYDSAYRVKAVASIEKDKYFVRNLSSPEQFETRIEAPAHLVRGLWTVDQIPTERLIAPLVVLDVSAKITDDPDYQISVEDIARWEKAYGQVPLGSVVMARTGWDSRWYSVKDYRNADLEGITHFPGYSPDAAKFLVNGRNVLGLGIDTLSVDHGLSKNFPVRQYILAHSVYELENVANLGRAPTTGGLVVVAPAKLESISSGPARVMALVR
jgi:kynurenine formamidase